MEPLCVREGLSTTHLSVHVNEAAVEPVCVWEALSTTHLSVSVNEAAVEPVCVREALRASAFSHAHDAVLLGVQNASL